MVQGIYNRLLFFNRDNKLLNELVKFVGTQTSEVFKTSEVSQKKLFWKIIFNFSESSVAITDIMLSIVSLCRIGSLFS